jgi:hypothetical protein
MIDFMESLYWCGWWRVRGKAPPMQFRKTREGLRSNGYFGLKKHKTHISVKGFPPGL